MGFFNLGNGSNGTIPEQDGFFRHDPVPPEQGGMFDGILASLLARYGITQEHIDKVKVILDKVKITDDEISVNLNGVELKIKR